MLMIMVTCEPGLTFRCSVQWLAANYSRMLIDLYIDIDHFVVLCSENVARSNESSVNVF